VVLYDQEDEGVVTVKFRDNESAKACVAVCVTGFSHL
jgi:hypothetical protein